ncbi:MAG: Lrp/AsnC family transcriptional regulator [Actinobacteria bacterium]|nr:Lrp/AsnC family transcriptional regulator [Actinomycetota bacterium]
MSATTQRGEIDRADARLLLALVDDPRATVVSLAERTGLSRNTVQARLARFDERGALRSFDHRIDPGSLGYPLTAFISIQVVQRQLSEVAEALAGVPEVLEISGLSGTWDLLARVVARDADDLYRIAGQILASEGVQRTESSLVMRRLVDYNLTPLLRIAAGS